MERKYRIKIIERKNGKKDYVPQVRSKLLFDYPLWHNLVETRYGSTRHVSVEETMTQYFSTEEEAEEMIGLHKDKVKQEYLQSTKETSYKYL